MQGLGAVVAGSSGSNSVIFKGRGEGSDDLERELEGLSLPNQRNLRDEGKRGREGGSGSRGEAVLLLLSTLSRAVVVVVAGFVEEGITCGEETREMLVLALVVS